MSTTLVSPRTSLILKLTRNEWSDKARAASAKKRKEKAQQKGSWWGTAGKAALIGGGALAGGILGARTLPRLIGKGRALEAGESLAGKILYSHQGLTKPSDIIRLPGGKPLEQILRRASKDKGLKGSAARAARKVDEFLGIPQRHYAVGLGGGRVADITRGEGQRIIPASRLGKEIRVHGEGRLVPKGTKMADEAKTMNPKELKAFEERYGNMKDWKKGDLCTIGDKNCEAYARGIGEGRKISTQIRALKAGLAGGAVIGATPGVAMSIPRKKKVTQNKWSDAARRKSAEARKRKAMSGAKKGALIGAGTAGAASGLAHVAHAGLMRSVEESMRIPGLSNDAARSLLRVPLKARIAGVAGSMALGGLAGAGIGKLLEKFRNRRKLQSDMDAHLDKTVARLRKQGKKVTLDPKSKGSERGYYVKNVLQVINGGPGSGHHGHKGIPGQRGGSLPEGASAPSGRQYTRELRALIPAAPVSETPQARAKRIKNVYTKASKLADVYEAYAGELEKKRWNKLLPLKKAQVEELARVHAKAAENFYSSADQATLLKGRTAEEQIGRLRKADHHAALAMKYTKRLGYNPTTGRPLPKSAMGEFTRSVGKAFVAGLTGGVQEAAYKAGRTTTAAGLDIAKEAIIGGVRGGQKAAEEPAERRASAIADIRQELARSRQYHGGARNLVKGKARKMKSELPSRDASFRDILRGIAAGAGKSGKARAAAYKDYYTKRSDLDMDLETTRQTIQKILDARAQLEGEAARGGFSLQGRAKKPKTSRRSSGQAFKPVPVTIGAGGKPVEASNKDVNERLNELAEEARKARADVPENRVDQEFTANFNPITANLSGQVRRETLHGKEFLVAPLSMIVPGVLPGSKGPLLYPEEEVRKNPSAWNNIPIVVNHPMKDGIPVEARSPDILERYQIGTVFNAKYNGKLIAEGWFDVERTRKVNTGVYDMLLNGRPIELSTGLYTDNEPFEGVHNGREYKFIARNYRPDHLAILLTSKGACSLKDGCGVLINKWTDEARRKSAEARKSKRRSGLKQDLKDAAIIAPVSTAAATGGYLLGGHIGTKLGKSADRLLSNPHFEFKYGNRGAIAGGLLAGLSGFALAKYLRNRGKNRPTANIVHKIKGGFELVSHKGKNLGTAKTKAGILKRERQVEYFNHVKNEQISPEVQAVLNGVYSAAGKQLVKDVWKIAKTPIKSVKAAGSRAVGKRVQKVTDKMRGIVPAEIAKPPKPKSSFIRRHPKTAMAVTGVTAYKYGRRKERKKQAVRNELSPKIKKRFKQAAGFAGGLGAGAAGTSIGAGVGSLVAPGVGTIIGGGIGAGVGGYLAHRTAKKFGGKSAAGAAGWGSLAGSIAAPTSMATGLAGRLAGRAATKAVAGKVGRSAVSKMGRSIKAGRFNVAAKRTKLVGKAAFRAAPAFVGRQVADAGSYAGTDVGLHKAFDPTKAAKKRKPVRNAWTDEARRKSAETRKRNAAARQGMGKAHAAGGGLAAGIVVARVAGGKIERATEFKHVKSGVQAVHKAVKKSFEPTVRYVHDPMSGRNILVRKSPGVGRKALRLLKRIRPRIGTLLRTMRK